VFCVATTVDGQGRPRSRMLHPIFGVRDGRPSGWALWRVQVVTGDQYPLGALTGRVWRAAAGAPDEP
jgi:hypothetical protein